MNEYLLPENCQKDAKLSQMQESNSSTIAAAKTIQTLAAIIIIKILSQSSLSEESVSFVINFSESASVRLLLKSVNSFYYSIFNCLT